MIRFSQFMKEDGVAVNNAGSGNVAGMGEGPAGEPGVDLKNKKKVILASMAKRRQPGKANA